MLFVNICISMTLLYIIAKEVVNGIYKDAKLANKSISE